jgi:hypothetical protein
LVWRLYHWGLPQNRTFEFRTIGNNKVADEENGEMETSLAAVGNCLFTVVTMVSQVAMVTIVKSLC